MECKINNRTELIEKYLSGELSEQEKESFEEHYFECDECFQELVFQQETIDLIKTEGEIIFADYLNRKPISVRVKELLESLKPKPVPIQWRHVFAYGAVAILVVFLSTFFLINTLSEKSCYFNFDNKVPYEYQSTQLRSDAINTDANPIFNTFVNAFQLGIGNYNFLEYEKAIEIFVKIEPVVNDLKKQDKNEIYLPWIRNLYFFNGLSHLALSVSKDNRIDKNKKEQHAQEALYYIRRANSFSRQYHLSGNDREMYFLGLAFGINGIFDSAIETLKQVQPESEFYKKSKDLIQLWKDK